MSQALEKVRLIRDFQQETRTCLPKEPVMSKLSGGSPSVKSKAVYRVKNWSSYNRALVARGSLTVWLDDSLWKQWYNQGPPQRGAQFVYSDPTIEWILTMRLLLRLPLRQTQGFIQSLLELDAVGLGRRRTTRPCRVVKGPWRWCCRPNRPDARCTWWSIQPA